MPIIVKDYTWTQSSDSVHIRVPLDFGKHDKVDLFTTDSYIKAHFNPFFFEVFLLHDVDISKSKCLVKDDLLILDLMKRNHVEWEYLEKVLTKPEKMQMKQQILEKCQEEAKQASEDKRIKKSHMDRFTVQKAMDIDSKQHALMDSRRDAERKKAMDDLEKWRVTKDPLPEASVKTIEGSLQKATIVELPSSDDEADKIKYPVKQSKRVPLPKKPLKTPVKSEYVDKKKEQVAKRVLPKLRETSVMEITHTPRTFPTPSRESTAHEEETWLKNVTMARRATGFVSEDLRPEEQDPQWCKDKGDEFFRAGNFLGAISAYTHGITLSDKLPSLFSNRAATHYALGNFNKCVNDCSTAIELMVPACEGNRRSRAKCIARRGAALVRLGYLTKGINEMKAASKLLPNDEAIKKDIYDMERAWEQNPDSD